MHSVRIATRTSALALAQANVVAASLRTIAASLDDAELTVEIVGISTRGDRDRAKAIAAFGGDGAFTKELENALLDGRADVAVHSLKDLPTALGRDTTIGAVLDREDARDLLVSAGNRYRDLAALPEGAVIGTSSLRRKALIAAERPDLRVAELRGNVDTRVGKVLDGSLTAAILASAGIKRSGLAARIDGGSPLPIERFVPAPGQGAICAQCRAADVRTLALVAGIDHQQTRTATSVERAFLRRLGGGCLVPIGAFVGVGNSAGATMHAVIAAVDGSVAIRRSAKWPAFDEAEMTAAAEALADEMLATGGEEILARARAEQLSDNG